MGRVRACAAGTAVVTATALCCGVSDAVIVDVNQLPDTITVSTEQLALEVGDTTTLAATVRDSLGNPIQGITVAWSSSNAAVASVMGNANGSGFVTALSVGTTDFTGVASKSGKQVTVIVPTAVSSPPPLGDSEPSYNAATDALIDREDFDAFGSINGAGPTFVSKYRSGRVSANGVGIFGSSCNDPVCPEAENAGVVTLVTGRGAAGKALRLRYGGNDGADDIIVGTQGQLGSTGGLGGGLPEVAGPYTHFLFRTWVRFSPGADPAADNSSGVKGVMLWHTGDQRYQHSPHRLQDYHGGRYAETRWDAGPPHPPNSVTGLNHWRTPSGDAPRFSDYNDGAWHRFTVEVYSSGSTSGHIGERWWLDGVLVFDNVDNVGDLSWGADYDYTHPITHWMVFGNYVSSAAGASSPPFMVDFDDWIAWTN